MAKRQSDKQISKDDYEAQESSKGGTSFQGEFQKAEEDVLKKRRIVKVSKTKFGQSSSSTATNSSGTSSIFGGISLTRSNNNSSSSSSNNNNTPGNARPFSNFSFTGNTTTATTTTNNNNSSSIIPKGDGSNPAPASAYPVFATPRAAATPSTLTPAQGNTTSSSQGKQKLDRLASRFKKHIDSLPDNCLDPMAIERYLATVVSIYTQEKIQQSSGVTAPPEKTETTTTTQAVPARSTQPTFDFSMPAQATAPVSTSKEGSGFFTAPSAPAPATAPTASTSTGLFGNFSASASTASSSFKFGETPSSGSAFDGSAAPSTTTPNFGGFSTVPSPAVAAAASTTTSQTPGNDEDADDDPEKNRTEKALASNNESIDVSFEAKCRVYNYRGEGGKAQVHGGGVLKLERNKQTGKCQVVVRDETTGIVKFNVSIPSNARATLQTNPPSKNKPNGVGGVSIYGNEKGEPEPFLLLFNDMKTGEEAFKAYKSLANTA
ncbi:NUP50 nucleoporin [Nitzschia inconspicua]|uniref:NUP50 nucleoporin n=1 Tax=Nitzschia inconspicua TaxID=303405 RepID=A0A9K3PWI7_9STRA|nr:NUP50 nucleoporin [Nitzschia inconspicua]KAG7362278.1 NUP50 nucleoporin [Nitzschia inconspicua]